MASADESLKNPGEAVIIYSTAITGLSVPVALTVAKLTRFWIAATNSAEVPAPSVSFVGVNFGLALGVSCSRSLCLPDRLTVLVATCNHRMANLQSKVFSTCNHQGQKPKLSATEPAISGINLQSSDTNPNWVNLNKRHQSPIELQGVARCKLRLDRLLTLPVLSHSMNTGKIGLFDKKKHSNVRHFHLIFLIV